MKLIFIRHADPDYLNNTITEKGEREAELLAQRMASWKNITDIYCSPYGRAQDTLKPALLKMDRSATTLDWLREFDYHVIDPFTKKERSVCWDILPRNLYAEKKFFDRTKWSSVPYLKKANIDTYYSQVCYGFDTLLEAYDYTRIDADKAIYNCLPHLTDQEAACDSHLLASQKNLDDRNIVFVCHLGVMFALIGHLTGISPMQLWHGFFVAPTSVTVLGTEERVPGEVMFRVQTLGDVSHLTFAGESPSASGYFGNVTAF
ncbi:MAG TPA: histidine phosphatase family protein [Treponema sp.]|nr:histidine phosphatase family protein [Treponema sp.]